MTHQTMNSAGVIRADGQAKIQVGDSYTTIHSYLDLSHYLANSRLTVLAETDKAQLHTRCLQRLRTSPYEERKNRNPRRADGTCEWFTAHPLFQSWRKETSALLWVSADPGCGKSVLARYLVDDVFPSSATRTTCYFFFKDDFDDQRVLESGMCCLLHQLFTQKPVLLSDEILQDFREEGDQLFASYSRLWSVLIRAARNHSHGEVICILDALDECVGQKLLAEALTEHYSKGKGISTLKFLVTSRPYLRIQQDFQNLKESQPTIHLSGESEEEEVDKIAQEITICIEQRIEELCKRLKLTREEAQILYEELAAGSHRTYLWVHLQYDLRNSIRNLPRTVEEAYENILRKSRDPEKARKILHIVVAAERPLHLREIAAVLAFRGENHLCHKDLDQDLLSLDHIRMAIRENCGLFVVIQDSQVFLLHKTAREFLVQLPVEISDVRLPSLTWQHSLDPKESHLLLSEICIRYLLLAEFKGPVEARGSQEFQESDDRSGFVFLDYAASNWPNHYRQAHNTHGTDLEILALQLCDTDSPACSYWLGVYGEKRMQAPAFLRQLPTSLLIVSYFGLDNLVSLTLQDKKTSLSTTGPWPRRTALSWASEKGYNLIVQALLNRVPKYQVIFRDRLSSYPTIVNRTDALGKSPLDIVALLLEHGARQNSTSSHLETRNRYGQTPLTEAAMYGNEVVVQLLLDRGAKIDASDDSRCTALMYASSRSYNAIAKLLLDGGANVDASDERGRTALVCALLSRHDAMVKLLLDRGVDVENKDGWAALILSRLDPQARTLD
ncbi:hypothetical protein F5B18DRAFT_660161 [Nemania serpens]|nr:hypothetical protein F5B18DRAFT_660161 [Nemania serpens]